MWRKLLTLLNAALTDFSRNNCPYMAAGIAYWTIFCLLVRPRATSASTQVSQRKA